MAVMDIDRVFFCCLYGNTEDETIIREIHRDMAYEEEMVFLEQEFWDSHVQKQVPPPYLEEGTEKVVKCKSLTQYICCFYNSHHNILY